MVKSSANGGSRLWQATIPKRDHYWTSKNRPDLPHMGHQQLDCDVVVGKLYDWQSTEQLSLLAYCKRNLGL